MSYINGVSYPILEITDQYGQRLKENAYFALPLTNSGGLIETYEEQNIFYTYLNYKREKKILGYFVNFTLNYNEFANKDTMLKIFQLLNWEFAISTNPAYANYRIYLTPRADVPSRRFEVIGRNETMSMGVLRGGTLTAGHKGIVLNYTTKYLSNWDVRDPIAETFIIQDYQNHLII